MADLDENTAPHIPHGWCCFYRNEDVNLLVEVAGEKAGATAANVSGGYGGWEVVKRPRDDSIVEWVGHDARKLIVPVMFDGMIPNWKNPDPEEPWGSHCEHDIAILESFTEPEPNATEPFSILVLGSVIPHSHRHWVINNIAWAVDDIRRPTDGLRVRASATVELLEYIPTQLISASKSAASKHKRKRPVHTKSKKGKYRVKEGDSHLRHIAAKQLGSAAAWHSIADLNGIRDGSAITVGQILEMP